MIFNRVLSVSISSDEFIPRFGYFFMSLFCDVNMCMLQRMIYNDVLVMLLVCSMLFKPF